MIYCGQHRKREADYHCPHCEEGFCRECVEVRRYATTTMYLCPVCHNTMTALAPFVPAPPLWRVLPEMAAFPFRQRGWVLFLIWAVVGVAMRVLAAPGLSEEGAGFFAIHGVVVYAVYFSFLATVFNRLISRAEKGQLDMPPSGEYDSFFQSFFKPVFNFLGAVSTALWPLYLVPLVLWFIRPGDLDWWSKAFKHPATITIDAIFIFIGVIFMPMSFLVLGVTANLKIIENPLSLWREIRKIPKEYAITLAIFAGTIGAYVGLRRLMVLNLASGAVGPWLLYHVLDAELHLSLFMFFGHLLGYLGYQTRFKLRWWPETSEEPVFWIGGQRVMLSWKYETPPAGESAPRRTRPENRHPAQAGDAPAPRLDLERERALSEKVAEGEYLMGHGSYDQALPKFKEVLAERADHFEALRGVVMAAFRLEDYDTVRQYARAVAEELGKQYAFDALWDMYRDYKRTMPDFTFAPPELIKLSDWLLGENNHLDAARILRELAVVYQTHPLAPEALFQCAQILADQGGKPDTASNLLAVLIKRYPESEYAAKAQERLAQLSGALAPEPESPRRL